MTIKLKDEATVWHPYTHLKYQDNIPVIKAKDSILYTEDGREIIDAISSWWVTVHGHANKKIQAALNKQFETIDHVLFAGVTHEPAVNLAEKLLNHLPKGYDKIFYSDNGSTAVEVSIKMALQYFYNLGEKRKKIVAFTGSYHGDTFGAMAVSDRSLFTRPFHDMLFDVTFIDVPVKGHEEMTLKQVDALVTHGGDEIAAFIFEPLVLGTAGMVMYEIEVLEQIIIKLRSAGALIIADEVMTGFGRTGTLFAMSQVNVPADITCLSKGITGGVLPLGVTACKNKLYDVFKNEDKSKSFFHGHSYTANALACAVALASLELFDTVCYKRIKDIEDRHKHFSSSINIEGVIKEIRIKGTIVALEFITTDSSYLGNFRDTAYNFFMKHNILLRPLGNIIYVMPPYCITDEQLSEVYDRIKDFIAVYQQNVQQ